MGRDAKYVVRLSVEERRRLENVVARERVARATRERAMVLLRVDRAEFESIPSDEQVAELVGVSRATVERTRQRFVEEGLENTLRRKPARNRQYRKLDGAQEAKLVALACSEPPAGRVCWTMQLLADKLVEMQVVGTIGPEAVRTTLKKTTSNLGSKCNGCCRPSKTPILSARWKTFWRSTIGPTTCGIR
jgi:transposase